MMYRLKVKNLKKLTEEAQKNLASTQEQPAVTTSAEEKINQTVSTEPKATREDRKY